MASVVCSLKGDWWADECDYRRTHPGCIDAKYYLCVYVLVLERNGATPRPLLLLVSFLLLGGLHKTLVETTDAVPDCGKRKTFKDITRLPGQFKETLCELVVVVLLSLGVVQRVTVLKVLLAVIDQVGLEFRIRLPTVLGSQYILQLYSFRKSNTYTLFVKGRRWNGIRDIEREFFRIFIVGHFGGLGRHEKTWDRWTLAEACQTRMLIILVPVKFECLLVL